MPSINLIKLLRFFYETRYNYLPVVESTDGTVDSAYPLLGFLSRDWLNREMSDLQRAGKNFDEIPSGVLLQDPLPSDLLSSLSDVKTIPVLNRYAEHVANWDSTQILKAVAIWRETRAKELSIKGPESPAEGRASGEGRQEGGEDAGEWLSRLLLSAIRHPLFATDLQGKTLFFNRTFEETVLKKERLKNSLRLAEGYFLEVTRNLLAGKLAGEIPGGGRSPILRTRIGELDLSVEVQSIEANGNITGYLYLFYDTRDGIQEVLEELLEGSSTLTDALEDIEGELIYRTLLRQGQNISHTAKALGIRRSTLQNRIKKLRIDEKYERRVDGPIRRIRRTRAELQREQIGDREPARSGEKSNHSPQKGEGRTEVSPGKKGKKELPRAKKGAKKGKRS